MAQRALDLTLGLTEILLDLALGFLCPTLQMLTRVTGRLTDIATKFAL